MDEELSAELLERADRDQATLFVTGSSAGANLAIRAVCEGETGISGLICRYGYYGDLAPRADMPPVLVVHGE
jgi:predicted esterase